MSLAWLVVDFNSYFASVEQQLDPRLRGKPVAVVPMANVDSTCAIAASFEAKKFGVKTGTSVADARRMCPGIIFIEAQHDRYVRYHHQLITCIESCLHVDRVMSIDEVACELPKNYRTRERATELAQKIKATIARNAGECLTCSIGIAPNVYLAKTASDMMKPDGLVFIEKEQLPHILHSLQPRDLCGIGKKMDLRLYARGIRTVEQLCALDKDAMREIWNGYEGERMWRFLRGEDLGFRETATTTLGHSHVLPPEERNDPAAARVLNRLLQKAAMRLRHIGYLAGALSVSLKYINGTRWSDDLVFQETSDTVHFLHSFKDLWQRRPMTTVPPIAVGVTLHRLVALANSTPALFHDGPHRDKLNTALDKLNERFGKNTVYFGGAHGALKSAPMRIAFTHVPDLQVESDD